MVLCKTWLYYHGLFYCVTGFDQEQGKFVGLPPQWQSVVNPEIKERPKPIVDPSCITPIEKVVIDMQ